MFRGGTKQIVYRNKLFERYGIKFGAKNGHQKDKYVYDIKIHAKTMLIVLASIINICD